MQRDDELWELLITFALGSADLTGALRTPSAAHHHVPYPIMKVTPEARTLMTANMGSWLPGRSLLLSGKLIKRCVPE